MSSDLPHRRSDHHPPTPALRPPASDFLPPPSDLGSPPSVAPLPYGRQSIDEDDIAAVAGVLRGDWLTQGPGVAAFEEAFAARVGAKQAVAVNSGTAALHAAMFALGIGPGDEVIVPPITFTATANCVVFQGGTPVFADVDAESGLIDPAQVAQRITKRTRAIIAVDYAGLPCDYDALRGIAAAHGLALVADACHALGATRRGRPAGSLADLNCFSFHPVKHIATGEGGMITTDDDALAQHMRDFRSHGITKDATRFRGLGGASGRLVDSSRKSEVGGQKSDLRSPISNLTESGPWYYEMLALGFNYRISDINCALGLSQLRKLDRFVARRRAIAAAYYEGLAGVPHLQLPPSDLQPAARIPQPATNNEAPITTNQEPRTRNQEPRTRNQEPGTRNQEPRTRNQEPSSHAFHLFPLRIDFAALGRTRTQVMAELRAFGIGTQVHYIPVCLQPFYRERFGLGRGHCPAAEQFYTRTLSIPMYPGLSDDDVGRVITGVRRVLCGAG